MTQRGRSTKRGARRPPAAAERERPANHRPRRGVGELVASLRLPARDVKYHIPEEVSFRAQTLKREHRDSLRLHLIGRSRQKLPIFALQIGSGERVMLAVANLHAGEAVGTTTLMVLAHNLLKNPLFQPLCERFTFLFLPQMNPDGMNWNLGWMKTDFNLSRYVGQHFRDLPDDEIDYGFPLSDRESVRPEVGAVTRFLQDWPRVDILVQLRGSVMSGGVGFGLQPAVEETWTPVIRSLDETCARLKLPLHDVDLCGRYGLERVRPGYQSLPASEAVREFYRLGDPDYAEAFRSSMGEYLQQHCGTACALSITAPFARVDGLRETKPAGRPRAALEEERSGACRETAEALERALGRLRLPSGVPGEAAQWLDYYRRLADVCRVTGAALDADRERFGDAEATRGDVLEMRIDTDLLRFLPLTAPLHVLRVVDHPACRGQLMENQEGLKRRFQAFQSRYRWSYVPLRDHIKLQLTAVLAATLKAE